MGDTSIKSLKRIDNNGVMHAWEVFAEKKQRFTAISREIHEVDNAIDNAWKGKAHEEYSDQFANIFDQVKDIGDSLTEIADALKETIYGGFYLADDSLNQQLLEAQHNTRKGSSGSSGGGGEDYNRLKPREVLYSTIKAAYIPNLAYPQLPARPVLVSTIGKAYQPNLAYQAMTTKPVPASCLPSAQVLDIVYRNLPQRETIASMIGDALTADISYMELMLRERLTSTIGEAYIPDLSYIPLALRSLDAETLARYQEYLLDYSSASPNLQQVKNTLMATQINQIVLLSLAYNRPDAETASLIGEAVVGNIHGELDGPARENLVRIIGDSVFRKMYGRFPGEASSGTSVSVDWIDSDAEKFRLELIRDTAGRFVPLVSRTFRNEVTGLRPAAHATSVMEVVTGTGPAKTTAGIIAPRAEIGAVAVQKVVTAVSNLAETENRRTIETCICQSAAQKAGAAALMPVSAVRQTVTGNTIIMDGGTPLATQQTVISGVGEKLTVAAEETLSQIVNQWSSKAGRFDFSQLRYPSPYDTSPGPKM